MKAHLCKPGKKPYETRGIMERYTDVFGVSKK
jgi:hypothetical protein